jgi:ribosome-associated toxin RatA of RatAB toxin-antitoxin module
VLAASCALVAASASAQSRAAPSRAASSPAVASSGAPSGAAPRSFSAAERQTLERGGLVVRRRTERRGTQTLVGGTSWQMIALPADAVWRALLDTARYPKMLPACTAARVLATRGDQRTVALVHEVGPIRADYALNARVDASRRDLTFAIDPARPHSVRTAWGFFTVRAQGASRSVLSYGLMADYGDGLFGGLLRPKLREWSLRVPALVKAFVEGEGRARYLPGPPLREGFVAGRAAPGLPADPRPVGAVGLVVPESPPRLAVTAPAPAVSDARSASSAAR